MAAPLMDIAVSRNGRRGLNVWFAILLVFLYTLKSGGGMGGLSEAVLASAAWVPETTVRSAARGWSAVVAGAARSADL